MKAKSEKQRLNEESIKKTTWPQIKMYMRTANKTPAQLSSEIGITRANFDNISQGGLAKQTCYNLAQVMGCEPEELCPRYAHLNSERKRETDGEEYTTEETPEVRELKAEIEDLEKQAEQYRAIVRAFLKTKDTLLQIAGIMERQYKKVFPEPEEVTMTLTTTKPEGEGNV